VNGHIETSRDLIRPRSRLAALHGVANVSEAGVDATLAADDIATDTVDRVERVVAEASEQPVGSFAAGDVVVAFAAGDDVVAAPGDHPIGSLGSPQALGVGTSAQDVVAQSAGEHVPARTTSQHVAEEPIITGGSSGGQRVQ